MSILSPSWFSVFLFAVWFQGRPRMSRALKPIWWLEEQEATLKQNSVAGLGSGDFPVLQSREARACWEGPGRQVPFPRL